jgi:hypothetical protein
MVLYRAMFCCRTEIIRSAQSDQELSIKDLKELPVTWNTRQMVVDRNLRFFSLNGIFGLRNYKIPALHLKSVRRPNKESILF